MRIICQQLAPTVGDDAANDEATIAAVQDAITRGGDLIVLPELCTSGYVFADASEVEAAAVTLDSPLIREWITALRGTHTILVAGIPLREPEGIANAAVMLDADGVQAVYRKVHLWDEEKRWFRAGSEPPAAASPAGERQAELHDAMSSARLSRIFIACCDRGGSERGSTFAGASAIIGPDGWLRAESESAGATTVQADVDLSEARDKATGRSNDVRADRRPDVYAATPLLP